MGATVAISFNANFLTEFYLPSGVKRVSPCKTIGKKQFIERMYPRLRLGMILVHRTVKKNRWWLYWAAHHPFIAAWSLWAPLNAAASWIALLNSSVTLSEERAAEQALKRIFELMLNPRRNPCWCQSVDLTCTETHSRRTVRMPNIQALCRTANDTVQSVKVKTQSAAWKVRDSS